MFLQTVIATKYRKNLNRIQSRKKLQRKVLFNSEYHQIQPLLFCSSSYNLKSWVQEKLDWSRDFLPKPPIQNLLVWPICAFDSIAIGRDCDGRPLIWQFSSWVNCAGVNFVTIDICALFNNYFNSNFNVIFIICKYLQYNNCDHAWLEYACHFNHGSDDTSKSRWWMFFFMRKFHFYLMIYISR